jgi:hypothetical protein
MKSSVLCLFSSWALVAWAEPLPHQAPKVQRDVATVSSAINDIKGSIERLDASVRAFDGDMATIQTDADNLVSTIETCTDQIDDSEDISIGDALGLSGAVLSLTSCGQNLISDLISRREVFETSMVCNTLESTMMAVNDATIKLTDSFTEKLPDFAESGAQDFINTLLSALADGVYEFSDVNCQDDVPASAPLLPTEGITTFPTSPMPTELITAGPEPVIETGATTVTFTNTDCESSSLPTPPPSVTLVPSAPPVLSTATPSSITTSFGVPSNSTVPAETPTSVPSVPSTTAIPVSGALRHAARPLCVVAGVALVLLI